MKRKRVVRPGVRSGYDKWAQDYDRTINPVVALERRHAMSLLRPRHNERIIDAGCGTGVHLRSMQRAGSQPIGVDFSHGMLCVAQRNNPGVRLVEADLNRQLPFTRHAFDAFLCGLVSEHLTSLPTLFSEAFGSLKAGGRLVFCAFHPEPASAGIEANFTHHDVEFRLGAEPHSVDDYLNHIDDAGFGDVRWATYCGDAALAKAIPQASKYIGAPLLLTITALRP